MAWSNAGPQTTNAGDCRVGQQECPDRLGAADKGWDLSISGCPRVGGANARLSEGVRRSADRYGATSVRRGWENQSHGESFERVPVVPTLVLPYGPAAQIRRIRGLTHGSTRSRTAPVPTFPLHPKGRPHMLMRDGGGQALSARSKTVGARHVGGGPDLINGNQVGRLKVRLGF
jgi:hypothetical protein